MCNDSLDFVEKDQHHFERLNSSTGSIRKDRRKREPQLRGLMEEHYVLCSTGTQMHQFSTPFGSVVMYPSNKVYGRQQIALKRKRMWETAESE